LPFNGALQGVIFTNSLNDALLLKQVFELNLPQFNDGADILKNVYNKYEILNAINTILGDKFLQNGEY
jgi:hypothetical protein